MTWRTTLLFLVFFCLAEIPVRCQTPALQDALDRLATTRTDSTRAVAYLDVGSNYLRSEPELAERYIDSAAAIKPYMEYADASFRINYWRSRAKYNQRNIDESISLIQKALEGFTGLGDQYMVMSCHYFYGRIHATKSDYVNANQAFQKSLGIAEVIKDSTFIANSLNALGVGLRRLGDNEKALSYYDRSLVMAEAQGNQRGITIALINKGIIEKKRNNFNQALKHYKSAESSHKKESAPNDIDLSMIYGNMSSLYSEMGEFKKAIDLSLKTIDLRQKVASSQEKANAYLGLSVNYGRTGEFDKALESIQKAESEVDTSDHYSMVDISGQYANIYNAQNKNKLAFKYVKKEMMHRDSLYNLESRKQLENLSEKYESEKKEQEIALLNSQNELQESQLRASLNISILLGLGLLGLLGLLYYLFQLNQKIKKSESEKDTLLKEIHHRVKNNLQVVSALLTLQSKHLKDEKAISALEEGKGRVNSMALIHQDLYQHDNLKGVNSKDYISKLVKDLLSTYHVDQKKIHVDSDIDSIMLDVDTMVPLGLVVNELITNSIKHAFELQEAGWIKILLKESNDQLFLEVRDNGKGVEPNVLESKSFGYSLIRSFARRLDADMEVESNEGLIVKMGIKNYQKAV